jgi:hypothetical protein
MCPPPGYPGRLIRNVRRLPDVVFEMRGFT